MLKKYASLTAHPFRSVESLCLEKETIIILWIHHFYAKERICSTKKNSIQHPTTRLYGNPTQKHTTKVRNDASSPVFHSSWKTGKNRKKYKHQSTDSRSSAEEKIKHVVLLGPPSSCWQYFSQSEFQGMPMVSRSASLRDIICFRTCFSASALKPSSVVTGEKTDKRAVSRTGKEKATRYQEEKLHKMIEDKKQKQILRKGLFVHTHTNTYVLVVHVCAFIHTHDHVTTHKKHRGKYMGITCKLSVCIYRGRSRQNKLRS